MGVRRRHSTIASLALLSALALSAGACGSDDDDSGSGGDLVVYSSLPLQGPTSTVTKPVVQGIELALKQAHGKAGGEKVHYESLDDSTAQTGNWDPQQTAANARKAAQDRRTIAYIGEFNSGASAVSIPILNQVGIAQISPSNTYVGLTTDEPGSAPGEPSKYQPRGKTFARIVPRDAVQASALLARAREDGCRRIALANDKDTYGAGLARLLEIKAEQQGVTISSNTGIQRDAPNFRAYAGKLAGEGADCFIFAGSVANGGVQILKDVAAARPEARLYGPDGMCVSGLTNPDENGIPPEIAKRYRCTIPTLDLKSYPGGADFLDAFEAEYGNANPDPYALYGYEAMRLVLDTIKAGGTTRELFVVKLFATEERDSVLGTYSIDANGDTTLTKYGVYKVGPDGNPRFESAIEAGS